MFRLLTENRIEIRRGGWHSLKPILVAALRLRCCLERWNGHRWETDSSAFIAARMR